MITLISVPFLYDFMMTRPGNVTARFSLVEKSLVMIATNPVMGVGLNNHTAAKKRMFVPSEIGEARFPVHNHYLALASEVGLVGFALQMAFFFLILRAAVRCSRSRDITVAAFSIAAAAAFGSIYLNLMADHLHGNTPRTMLFFYAGLVMACLRFRSEEEPAPEPGKPTLGRKPPSIEAAPSPPLRQPSR